MVNRIMKEEFGNVVFKKNGKNGYLYLGNGCFKKLKRFV
jgi:hypothetical protein